MNLKFKLSSKFRSIKQTFVVSENFNIFKSFKTSDFTLRPLLSHSCSHLTWSGQIFSRNWKSLSQRSYKFDQGNCRRPKKIMLRLEALNICLYIQLGCFPLPRGRWSRTTRWRLHRRRCRTCGSRWGIRIGFSQTLKKIV